MAGESYIGSKISLISLSDIRYIGILHSINAQDSTVGLKQVHSLGTEGRRGKPSEEIPPSDNVFDYVVFRGSDIKDLQVFEAPPKPTPPPQVSLPQDPAIMNMGSYSNVNTYNTVYNQPQPAPVQTSNYFPSNFAKEKLEKETIDTLKAELEDTTIDEAAIEQLAKKVSELNANYEEKAQDSTRRRNQNNNRGGRRYRQYNNKKDVAVPNSEFDFEASNAKFDKKEIKKEGEETQETEIEIPEPEEFYDKTSSFFDNISCESKERIEQQNEPRRNRFQEERKLNMETFGQVTVDQSRYRNNNYRGRGNYRNNRGGYYRSNNNTNRQSDQ